MCVLNYVQKIKQKVLLKFEKWSGFCRARLEILHAFFVISKGSIVLLAGAWNKKKLISLSIFCSFELGNTRCNKVKNVFGGFWKKCRAVAFIKQLEAKDFNAGLVIFVGRKVGRETSSKPVKPLRSEFAPLLTITSFVVIIAIFNKWPLEGHQTPW